MNSTVPNKYDVKIFDEMIQSDEWNNRVDKGKKRKFYYKIHRQIREFPKSYEEFSAKSKRKVRSIINRPELELIFGSANGMEDRKKFWPNYSESIHQIYYSPYPESIVIMEFDHHYICEFVKVSNACYFYPKDLIDDYKKLDFTKLSKEMKWKHQTRIDLASHIDILKEICNEYREVDVLDPHKSKITFKNRAAAAYNELLKANHFKLKGTELYPIYPDEKFRGVKHFRLSHGHDWKNGFEKYLAKMGYREDEL